MKADKYSGIVTVIAVILAVVYADGKYDLWDATLGVLAVVLAYRYKESIDENELLMPFFSAFLFAIGIIVILYTLIFYLPKIDWVVKIFGWHKGPLETQFILVMILTCIYTYRWKLKGSERK